MVDFHILFVVGDRLVFIITFVKVTFIKSTIIETPLINLYFLDPTATDPYESRMVYVGQSEIPGASEGLFANCEIETGTIAAFYNGSRADPKDFDPSTWETNNYK